LARAPARPARITGMLHRPGGETLFCGSADIKAVARDPRAAAIVAEILSRRPDLGEEEIWGLIHRKMEEMGSGYLTEVGAGYLVASDLGVDLGTLPRQPLRIAELRPGLKRVDVKALFLCKGRELSFEGRNSGVGKAYIYYIFDTGAVVRLVVWGDPDFRKVMDTLKPGDALTISGASTRLGRSGGIEVHVDGRGALDLPHESPPKGVLETITMGVPEVKEDPLGVPVVVRGKVTSDVQGREYTRGSSTRPMSFFTISGEDGAGRLRVVIWGRSADSLQGVGPGAVVRLVCFRVRRGRDGSLELHGDDGSTVEVISGVPARARSNEMFLVSSDVVPSGAAAEAAFLSGDDLVRVVATGAAAEAITSAPPGSIMKLRSTRVSERGDVEVLGRRPDLLDQLRITSKDLEAYDRRICVFEGVVLSRATEREVTSRSGEGIRRASLMLGDHAGEVELAAWRDAADKLMGLEVGERVRIYGALVVKREGYPPSLEARGYTRIERAGS